MGRLRKGSYTRREWFEGKHRFEHWYRDNTVYFITSKVKDGKYLLESEGAKDVFWDRFGHYSAMRGFVPWVTTVMHNHYHTLGYLKVGEELGEMMRKVHGSVAWEVMKLAGRRGTRITSTGAFGTWFRRTGRTGTC